MPSLVRPCRLVRQGLHRLLAGENVGWGGLYPVDIQRFLSHFTPSGQVISMIIRKAVEADIPEMHRIRMSVIENQLSDPTAVQPHHYRALLGDRGCGWVAEDERCVQGFAVADLARANVWALFVDPAHEGRGVGRALHDAMLDWLFESGTEIVWLSTPGTRAERFYRSAGWRYAGPQPGGEARFEMSRGSWRISPPLCR